MTFDSFVKMATTLTWKKVALLAASGLLYVALTTLYDNRQVVYESFIRGERLVPSYLSDLSPASKTAVEKFMSTNPAVAFLSIVRFDTPRNMRIPIHRAFNDREVERLVTNYEKDGITGQMAIFQKDNVAHNNQMISIINGEYSCTPFDSGSLAALMPSLKGTIKTSCRAPIPPGWAQGAAGYIVIHLKSEVPAVQLENIKLSALALSLYIFNTDVKGARQVKLLP